MTLRELKDNCDWERACEALGLNPWCLNEGADDMGTIEMSREDAIKIGIKFTLRFGEKND